MKFFNCFLLFVIFSLAAALIAAYFIPVQASSVGISAYIASICGDGEKEFDEQCDGSDLAGQTCAGLGYDSGTLSCSDVCVFNTSSCVSAPPSTPSSGGGGGGAVLPPATSVILQGKAYPNASLTVLKDGQVVVMATADSQADFKVQLTTLTAGIYTFGIWAEDKNGVKSIMFSFTVTVTSGAVTTISGIFIPPTINLSKQIVSRGEILDIYGQTAPQSDVDVYIYSDEIIKKVKANEIGVWIYPLNTIILDEGTHITKAKAVSDDLVSFAFSQALSFYVAGSVVGGVDSIKKADINKDDRVNLIDFSILLYWWGKSSDTADLNNNGVVDLTDFSIMMYWWTG